MLTLGGQNVSCSSYKREAEMIKLHKIHRTVVVCGHRKKIELYDVLIVFYVQLVMKNVQIYLHD